MKLQELFEVFIKATCCLSYVFVPESVPMKLQMQKQTRLFKLTVRASKTNHPIPPREGNWQTQSAWNSCKAESKGRSDENISLQPVC